MVFYHTANGKKGTKLMRVTLAIAYMHGSWSEHDVILDIPEDTAKERILELAEQKFLAEDYDGQTTISFIHLYWYGAKDENDEDA